MHSKAADEMLVLYRKTRRRSLRDDLVDHYLPVVRQVAARFEGRGEPIDDLVQVGSIGLLHAVERFDPERKHRFLTYAVPLITGEIRRHLRDRVDLVPISRSVRETQAGIIRARWLLSMRQGRCPSDTEVAETLGISEQRLSEVGRLCRLRRVASLDAPFFDDSAGGMLFRAETAGERDPAIENFPWRADLLHALGYLHPREASVVRLRFVYGCTQREISRRLGISQTHVCRLEQRALGRLRSHLEEPAPSPMRTRVLP